MVAVSNGFLLPMRVVMAVFRGKLRAAIHQGVAQGMLQLPRGKSQQPVENLLNQLGRRQWHVHIREWYPSGQGVLISLARYLRGGPSLSRGCSRAMANRWSFGIPSGPQAQEARRPSGRGAWPSSRSLGAGGGMCPRLGPCGCVAGGAMPTPRVTSWPGADSRWGKPR
jgi:hypothetical protein